MSFVQDYFAQTAQIAQSIDTDAVERVVELLVKTRDGGGRLFFVGSGGGAGHSSHATCDFRKIGGFEAYCPTDNVSELSARVNDDGWETSLSNYLRGSKLRSNDCLFVFSVGGGSEEKNISMNLVNAVRLAREVGASVVGVVGRDGGYTASASDACVIVPTVDSALITAHTEAFQAVVWHMLVSHPAIQQHEMKWESTK
ncbi:MAG: SIS domain-containing protein [Bacteroidota bacterium]